jgi:hypothetical protein
MADEWPTLGEELARKAMGRITTDLIRYQAGELSAARVLLTADILSDVTQGLIDNETWNTIYAVRGEMTKVIQEARK